MLQQECIILSVPKLEIASNQSIFEYLLLMSQTKFLNVFAFVQYCQDNALG